MSPAGGVTPARLRSAAKLYASNGAGPGWRVFPVWGIVNGKCECAAGHLSQKDGGKHPVGGNGHKDATTDQDVLDAFWPPADALRWHNIGVPCADNGLVVVDVDPRHGGDESWDRLEALAGGLPATLTALTGEWGTARGPKRGRHHYFRDPGGITFHGRLDDYPGIDLKHQGYVLAAPSLHISGETYEWAVRGGPMAVAVSELPEELLKLYRKGTKRSRPGGAAGSAQDTYGAFDWEGKTYDIDGLIRKGIPKGQRVDTIYPIMCHFANQYPVKEGHGAASFRRVVSVFNNAACRPPLDEDELEGQMRRAIDFVIENPKERSAERALGSDVMAWVKEQKDEAARAAPAAPATADELLKAAAAAGGSGSSSAPTAPPGGGYASLPPDVDELDVPDDRAFLPRSLTDMGDARRLAEHYRGRIKYTEGMGWFVWDEQRRYWRPDVVGQVALDRAAALPGLVARELLVFDPTTDEGKAVARWSMESRSTARLGAAMKQWQVRPWVRAPVAAWDSHRDLLGVRNGVVDLRTGTLLPGEPELGITKRTDVAYEKGMRAVKWEQFLEFATGGDKALERWLQLAAGYTLTGRNDQDVFFIVFGRPGSGKSTFLEALSHVLGEQYSIHLPVTALIDDGRNSQDEYYRAQLPGKRMAVFSEWPQGKRTKEDAIKALTGDLTMTGRHPTERPFTFQSQAKLWMGTNVTPAINDQAMWRRIRAIPFDHVPERPDPDLKVWLSDPEGGLPAVMAWCVEGAERLLASPQRDPLGWCRAVEDASAEYRAQEDRMGQFLDEETKAEPGRSVPVVALYEVYKVWAEDRGEKGMTRIPFEKALAERGVKVAGRGRHGTVEGVSLRPRSAIGAMEGASAGELRAIAQQWQQ